MEVTEITIDYALWDTDGSWEIMFADPEAEYQWVYCENYEPLEGENQSVFGLWSELMFDTYYACIITLNGCSDTTECFFYTDEAVEDWNDGSITLYPNPTMGMVSVQCTMNNGQWMGGEIQVLDVYGRLLDVVAVETVHAPSLQTTTIDLSRYATGVYIIKWVNDGRVVTTGKVVKE